MRKNSSKNKSKRAQLPRKQRVRFIYVINVLVFSFGLILTLFFGHSIFAESESSPSPVRSVRDPHTPTAISIPSLTFKLPVFETTIADETWEIHKDGVSYLGASARPGTKGTIVLYAHNTQDRFGSLPSIRTGDTIRLTTKDSGVYVYSVVETNVVDASDVSILESDGSEKLVVYTCFGFADSQRFVVFADRVTPSVSPEMTL